MAMKCGLQKRASESTKKRMTALKQRLKEPPFQKGWKEALEKIPNSDFMLGKTERSNWVVSLDFFLSPDGVVKILEGKYDNRVSETSASRLKEKLMKAHNLDEL
jgi:hypothetical protein